MSMNLGGQGQLEHPQNIPGILVSNFQGQYSAHTLLTDDLTVKIKRSNCQGQKKPLPKLCVIENSLVRLKLDLMPI